MRILIADDDLLMRQFLASILEGQGHSVVHAENGVDAWEKFRADPVRIVITDWKMPELSGIDLCRRIRVHDDSHYTYVIIVTSNNERDQVSEGLAAGADDFVSKPFDPTELRWRVNSGLRVLQLEDALAERIEELDRTAAELSKVNDRIRSELEAAADVQRSLVPVDRGDNDQFQFACRFHASDFLGGDGMNVIALDEDHVAVYVADVCGHGVKPALLAVSLHRVLTPTAGQDSLVVQHRPDGEIDHIASPAEVLSDLNRRFPMDLDTCMYFTMLYAVLNTRTGELRYASAGHPAPIRVQQDGTATQLPGSGLPVGMMELAEFDEESITLAPNDRLCFFTDGITEARSPSGEMFDETRLRDVLAGTVHESLESSLATAIGQVDNWHASGRHDDDRSLVLLELAGETAVEQERLRTPAETCVI